MHAHLQNEIAYHIFNMYHVKKKVNIYVQSELPASTRDPSCLPFKAPSLLSDLKFKAISEIPN
jgi:hypothetical protein